MEWKIIDAKQETDHRFLNFYVLRYEVDEDGVKKEYPYFIASRRQKEDLAVFGNADKGDAVIVLVVDDCRDDWRILLIDIFRPALNRRVIEFPAGLLGKEDEGSLIKAAIRETIEETGIHIKDPIVICPPSPTSTGLSDETNGVVLARIDESGARALEEFEDISYRFVNFSDIPGLLEDENVYMALSTRLCLLYLSEKRKNAK